MSRRVVILAIGLLCLFSLLAGAASLKSGGYANHSSPVFRLSHETMKVRSGQISFWGGSNQLSLTVAPEENGLYKLLIRAWGSLCEGEGPLMKLTVAGKDICVWSVDVRPAIYMSPAFELPAGEHEVVISFINDKAAGGEDRNLYLDGVAFGAVKSAEAVQVLLFDGKPLSSFGKPREGKILQIVGENPWEKGVEPFYPEKKQIPDYVSPVAPKGEITVKLANGASLKLDQFSTVVSLNGVWKISGLTNSTAPFPADEDLEKGYHLPQYDDSRWDNIEVPLDWYRKYPASRTEKEPFVKGWYRKTVDIPASYRGKRVFLHFDVIGYEALLFVNGKEVGSHHGDFTPWDVEITDFVNFGAQNTIAIRVFSDFGNKFGSPLPATHTYGSQWSIGNIKGGIWQNVSLRYEEPFYFQRVLITPVLEKKAVIVDYVVDNKTDAAKTLDLYATVVSAMKGDNQIAANLKLGTLTVNPGANSGELEIPLENPQLWSPDNPYLYYLSLALAEGNEIRTARTERFGYRDFKVIGKHFYLNGTRIYLFGENLSSVGYGGLGVSEEAERRALASKMIGFRRQGYNIIRNPHHPIIPLALEVADEVGMMIYNEWGWAFTNIIDEEEFEKRNLAELAEWLYRDYNHPSVVMWSTGNEVKHAGKPEVQRQLDKQVLLLRKLDRSGRPVCSFSGMANMPSYGFDKLETDFLDHHTYLGLGTAAWTNFGTNMETVFKNNISVYGADGKLPIPFIIWECVGYSWGFSYNPLFALNDIEQYAAYAESPTTWAEPNGIGFAGTIGLAAALDPKRGAQYGREHMGKRIIEAIRYEHDNVQGFAPWFHDSDTPAAALWNQPLFVGLRWDGGAFLTNLFSGESYPQNLFLVNSQSKSFSDLVVRITLVSTEGKSWLIDQVSLGALPAWEKVEQKRLLTIPAELEKGNYQIRVQVFSGETELSRNFYDVFVERKDALTAKIETKKKVAVWKTETEGYATLEAILGKLGIAATPISDLKNLNQYDVLIIPPSTEPLKYFTSGNRLEELLAWVYKGGRYLQLEQNYVGVSPVGQEIYPEDNTYVDLAIPAHPVFSGLAQRHFDTWTNPDFGYSIIYAFNPFTTNALAVRGPFLGARSVYNAVAEGTYGEGIIFTSQLLAATLWERDSAATTYLRNVLNYILSADKPSSYTQPWVVPKKGFTVAPQKVVTIDLKPYVTTGFADEVDGDKKGGWTDQGNNDMRMMVTGRQEFLGVPMEIIDPATNNGKSCIVLAGPSREYFPEKVEGIAVGQKLSRLFFLHSLAWSSGKKVGEYRIHYADQTTEIVDIVDGQNIGDWWFPGDLSQAYIAYFAENPVGRGVGLWLFAWENPKPDVAIVSIDFVSTGASVPALVAISGEKISENSLIIDDFELEKKWSCLRDTKTPTSEPLPVVERVSGQADETKVRQGQYAMKVTLPPKTETGGVPVIFTKFPLDLLQAGQDYDYLTFWLKAETGGAVSIVLPKDDWSARLGTNLTFRSGEWRKIRLNLREDMGLKNVQWGLDKLRGELFFYQMDTMNDTVFYLDDIRFE